MEREASAVQAARHVAAELWRGARSSAPWRSHGLNSESAVRRRLQWLAARLLAKVELPVPAERTLSTIDWFDDSAFAIARRIVHRLNQVKDTTEGWTRALARLVVVQRLAARLGWWPPGQDETEDYRVASLLYRGVDELPECSLAEAVANARRHHVDHRTEAALMGWLAADRIHRTPGPLLHAGALLCRAGRIRHARWVLRAALLEPADTFPSVEVFGRTRLLSAQLSLLLSHYRDLGGDVIASVQRAGEALDARILDAPRTSRPPSTAPVHRAYRPTPKPSAPMLGASAVPDPIPWSNSPLSAMSVLPPLENAGAFQEKTAPLAPRTMQAALLASAVTTPIAGRRAWLQPTPSGPISGSFHRLHHGEGGDEIVANPVAASFQRGGYADGLESFEMTQGLASGEDEWVGSAEQPLTLIQTNCDHNRDDSG